MAPTTTIMRKGTVVLGLSRASVMQLAKKGTPVQHRKFGVAFATPFQPNRLNMSGETNIMEPVTMPVHIATSPMKACATGFILLVEAARMKLQFAVQRLHILLHQMGLALSQFLSLRTMSRASDLARGLLSLPESCLMLREA